MKKRYYIVDMKKFIRFIILSILVASGIINLFIYGTIVYGESIEVSYESRIIKDGDTIWSIAKEHKPYKDPRISSYEILRINHLGDNDYIRPGDEILLPK